VFATGLRFYMLRNLTGPRLTEQWRNKLSGTYILQVAINTPGRRVQSSHFGGAGLRPRGRCTLAFPGRQAGGGGREEGAACTPIPIPAVIIEGSSNVTTSYFNYQPKELVGHRYGIKRTADEIRGAVDVSKHRKKNVGCRCAEKGKVIMSDMYLTVGRKVGGAASGTGEGALYAECCRTPSTGAVTVIVRTRTRNSLNGTVARCRGENITLGPPTIKGRTMATPFTLPKRDPRLTMRSSTDTAF